MRTTWLTLTASLIYERKYCRTRNNKFHVTYNKSHTYGNFNYSELCVPLSWFRLHGHFLALCRRSLKRTEKFLVKRTKIGQTRLIENRVVASFLTKCKPLPSQVSIFVSTFARVILSFNKSQAGRKQL